MVPTRRTALVTLASVATAPALAGCLGVLASEETIVDDTFVESDSFSFDLEEGDTITVELDNVDPGDAPGVGYAIAGPDNYEHTTDEPIEEAGEFEHEAPATGEYTVFLHPFGRMDATITLS